MALAENGSLSTHHSHANDDLDNSNPANQLNNNNSDEIAGDSEQPNNLVPADNQIHNLNAAQMNGVTVTDSADTHLAVANGNGHANGFNRNKGNFQSYENLTKSNGHGASDDGKDDGSDSSETEFGRNEGSEEGLKKEIGRLEEFFSNLNPRAAEFVPPSLKSHRSFPGKNPFGGSVNNFNLRQTAKPADANGLFGRTRRNNYGQGKRRINSRTSAAQREEVIRRTVYVSDIDQQVTEEQLALLFVSCGQVVDCRVCGDPNSVLRFAFIEFTDEDGARTALSLSGTMLGYYPVRVLPSKTAIAPVNPTFLPRSEDEREMCARTVYCTNIDKKNGCAINVKYMQITTQDVKLFFESLCGEVQRLRLLGDYHHSTRIAFVEFVIDVPGKYREYGACDYGCPQRAVSPTSNFILQAESATAALNCSGAMLGSLPIRVSPSKTPVRPRTPRSPLH